MGTLVSILIFLICLLLVLVVLVQNPKGGGLSSEFSGANQIGGVQKTADFLEKATWTLAIALVVLSLVSATFSSNPTQQEQMERSTTEDIIQNYQVKQPVGAQPGQQLPESAQPGGQGGGQKQGGGQQGQDKQKQE